MEAGNVHTNSQASMFGLTKDAVFNTLATLNTGVIISAGVSLISRASPALQLTAAGVSTIILGVGGLASSGIFDRLYDAARGEESSKPCNYKMAAFSAVAIVGGAALMAVSGSRMAAERCPPEPECKVTYRDCFGDHNRHHPACSHLETVEKIEPSLTGPRELPVAENSKQFINNVAALCRDYYWKGCERTIEDVDGSISKLQILAPSDGICRVGDETFTWDSIEERIAAVRGETAAEVFNVHVPRSSDEGVFATITYKNPLPTCPEKPAEQYGAPLSDTLRASVNRCQDLFKEHCDATTSGLTLHVGPNAAVSDPFALARWEQDVTCSNVSEDYELGVPADLAVEVGQYGIIEAMDDPSLTEVQAEILREKVACDKANGATAPCDMTMERTDRFDPEQGVWVTDAKVVITGAGSASPTKVAVPTAADVYNLHLTATPVEHPSATVVESGVKSGNHTDAETA